MISLQDRYCGTLVGALCGDALGAPYEWKSAEEVAVDLAQRGGLVAHDYVEPWKKKRLVPKGHPTDDSELTALLANSLARHGGLDPEKAYRALRMFIHGRISFLTDGEAYGSGSTLRAALAPDTYEESAALFASGKMPLVPSNGSLMRNAPVALACFGEKSGATVGMALAQSKLTHRHPLCAAACIVHALMHSYLLSGHGPKAAWECVGGAIALKLFETKYARALPVWNVPAELADALRDVLLLAPLPPELNEHVPNRYGSALVSLQIALWALLSAEDFRDGLTKAVSVGGDTDTYACIAGSLLGAHFGIEGIPHEWVSVLIGRRKMEMLA